MSTTIYIMRHGIAEERADSGEDADRRLTDEGRRKVLEIARGLKILGVKPHAFLSSPLPRAMETATLTASVLDKEAQVETADALATGYDAAAVVRSIERFKGAETMMLFGHQPQLGELASLLLTGAQSLVALPFKKGGVAAIEVANLPPRSAAELLWFMSPKQLRALS